MEILKCKARLSVLWVSMTIGFTAGWFISLMMPGVIEEMITGNFKGEPFTEGRMIIYSLIWLIPLVIAVLCLTLKNSKWLNLVLGIIFALFFIFELISRLTEGEVVPAAHWLIFIVGIVFAFFIAWFAWKWPKEEA